LNRRHNVEANNHISQFVAECCERSPSFKEDKVRLWEAYVAWCFQRAIPACKGEVFLEKLAHVGVRVSNDQALGVRLGTSART
jgi:phage/plasmid-associated DNA primase